MKGKKVVLNKQEPGWEEWVSSIRAAGRRNGHDPAGDASLREATSRLAYSYWEARGFQGGSAEEDWLRAEAEIREGIRSGATAGLSSKITELAETARA